MASREFSDALGQQWTVWDVHPTLTEANRRKVALGAKMAEGWLAFESGDGGRRRLAPIPEPPAGWPHASDSQLRSWLANAERYRLRVGWGNSCATRRTELRACRSHCRCKAR